MPPNESANVPQTILTLNADLSKPEASDPETRLRIMTIRGMLETNYDASMARTTWQEVESQALKLHHYALASRAEGEQGIAAFILGDTESAKKLVVRAWSLSKAEHDPAATVRYASIFGAGLVQIRRYKESLTPLNQAIDLASSKPEIAYPSIAIYAKMEALAGLRQYDEALRLANSSLTRLQGTLYDGHKAQVLITRGAIYTQKGDWATAIPDFRQSALYSRGMLNYRGITDADGRLAQAYEHTNRLPEALLAINEGIQANTMIPYELYLLPRNLAIKAEIMDRLGKTAQANVLYEKSLAIVNAMIQRAATTNIQRQLLTEMGEVYSGYFASLCNQKRYDEALQTLDEARGRVETESLEHHASQPVQSPSVEDRELTRLNLALINSDDPAQRASLTNAIYATELKTSPSAMAQETTTHPVHLTQLQHSLSPHEVLIEYVLAEPNSYALAVTENSVMFHRLPSKATIEADANLYRKEIHARKEDVPLSQRLFSELLQPITEYNKKQDLVIVPDGALHLLPFSALSDPGGYVVRSHTVAVTPSSTVFNILEQRRQSKEAVSMPYIGVAAWTQTADTRNALLRAVSGPQRSQLSALPDSKVEVEAIGADLPHPSTILLGADATEARFKNLPLDSTSVVHLALHGYADLDYPDRSALVFAPDASGQEDGLLQVREVRTLHLNAKLVTLSACNTGVGPTGEAGVANLVNAFIEAGADTVVSTLWELEDHSTEHLMTLFYSDLAAHSRKVDALRSAQLNFLNQGLSPYFWASFQIVGDPNGTIN